MKAIPTVPKKQVDLPPPPTRVWHLEAMPGAKAQAAGGLIASAGPLGKSNAVPLRNLSLFGTIRKFWRCVCLTVFLAGLLVPVPAVVAASADRSLKDLSEISLEDLINIKVTSVSKMETTLEASPAAIAVITQDDIRRLGITSIPEALRWVPGMNVGRIDSHTWAISARGFEGQFANKLLVLIDGRAIYQPGFAGVYWDAQDLVLEDLDRIEVIRGPGATLWGANAVNGVVNIITKSAKDTQGLLVSTAIGTEEQPSTSIRYGGQFATNLYYRTWVKYFNRGGLVDSTGHDAPDDWNAIRGGFRLDWEPSIENLLTLQGDYYSGETRENVQRARRTPPYSTNLNVVNHNNGGNILGRWTRTFSPNSQLSLQAYYSHYVHELGGNRDIDDTLDIELEDRFELGSWNNIIWGLGYRQIKDDFPGTGSIVWTPQRRTHRLYTAFLQDDITIVPDRLHLSLGSKFEHNSETGFEIQPGGRLLWTATERQTAWASVA